MSSVSSSLQLHQSVIPFIKDDVQPLIDLMQGKIRFSSQSFTTDELHAMLQTTLGTKVTCVTCVRRDVLEDTPYTSSKGFSRTFSEILDLRFGFGLRMKLGRQRYTGLRRHFGLEQVLPLAEAIAPDPMRIPRKNMVTALVYYFGACMAFDQVSVDRLTPLMHMMLNYMPLGKCAQTKGNIIVLTP